MVYERPELFTQDLKLSKNDIRDINYLIKQLSLKANKITLKRIMEINLKNLFLIVRTATPKGNDGKIIGMAMLAYYQKPTGLAGVIEDVVVHQKFRGKGIGRQMIEILIGHARKLNIKHIDLTSRSERMEANALYASMGFIRRETNIYRLKID